jgi:hypothetical protein
MLGSFLQQRADLPAPPQPPRVPTLAQSSSTVDPQPLDDFRKALALRDIRVTRSAEVDILDKTIQHFSRPNTPNLTYSSDVVAFLKGLKLAALTDIQHSEDKITREGKGK